MGLQKGPDMSRDLPSRLLHPQQPATAPTTALAVFHVRRPIFRGSLAVVRGIQVGVGVFFHKNNPCMGIGIYFRLFLKHSPSPWDCKASSSEALIDYRYYIIYYIYNSFHWDCRTSLYKSGSLNPGVESSPCKFLGSGW